MNERIKALKAKAEKFADVFCEDIGDDDLNHWSDAFSDQLAELIVRECAQLARDTNLEDVEGGDSDVLQAAKQQILEHFGVE